MSDWSASKCRREREDALRAEIARLTTERDVERERVRQMIAGKVADDQGHARAIALISERQAQELSAVRVTAGYLELLAERDALRERCAQMESLVSKGAEAMGFIRYAAGFYGLSGPEWSEEPGFAERFMKALTSDAAIKQSVETNIGLVRECSRLTMADAEKEERCATLERALQRWLEWDNAESEHGKGEPVRRGGRGRLVLDIPGWERVEHGRRLERGAAHSRAGCRNPEVRPAGWHAVRIL